MDIYQVIFRSLLAVIIGSLIGTERARHGRAAGMRTHILVCLGSAMTSMTGVYMQQLVGGDPFRIAAQVISGVGFLGAGMIILKNGNVITGLTTAAGVWATATIGIAIGFGFYTGAVTVALLFMITIILFAKLERGKRATEVIYIELDDMKRVNPIKEELKHIISVEFSFRVMPPKSGNPEHIGINLIIDKRFELDIDKLCHLDNVIFAVEE